uniref:Uncharacterized protein n=1 Tax=Triticum urartu TaxID=4572 RepID=A0A8R7PWR4_TRIUA
MNPAFSIPTRNLFLSSASSITGPCGCCRGQSRGEQDGSSRFLRRIWSPGVTPTSTQPRQHRCLERGVGGRRRRRRLEGKGQSFSPDSWRDCPMGYASMRVNNQVSGKDTWHDYFYSRMYSAVFYIKDES